MKRLFGALIFILTILPAFAMAHDHEFGCHIKDPQGRYREHNVDFIHMLLEVDFEPEAGKVNGLVHYEFTPKQQKVDTLFLDAPGIDIHYVLLDGDTMRFYTNEAGLIIQFAKTLSWGDKHKLSIGYTAFPEKGIYFIGWNDPTRRRRKQIWTQGQGIDNRHWIPCYDDVNDKLITETKITFTTGYEVISNGVLKSKTDRQDGYTTWHYAMSKPHVVYLVMIAVGDFAYKDMVSKSGVVSRQYYYPDEPQCFEPTYQYSNEMMDWIEEELGVPYPWEIYRNVPVQDFIYGAMENTTATIFGDFYLQDSRAALERNYIGTNAHELTHQWFGDYITEWSGTHHWLHESFATHYAKHFKRHIFGEDYYQWDRRGEMESSWRAAKQNSLPVAHSQAGAARHYPKGSLVIDMMRYVLGEDQFRKVMTAFLEQYPYDMVDTHLFYLEFIKNLGINLDWFFDQWLYKGGEPHYVITYKGEKDKTTFSVKQAHEINDYTGLFKMPLVFEVHYKDGTYDAVTEWIEKAEHEVTVLNPNMKQIDYVLFDPNWNVLKTVEFEKTYEEWAVQAQKARHMIDRYNAIDALKEYAPDKKRKLLTALFDKEPFYANRAAIVKQLANDNHKSSEALLVKALKDAHPIVRRSALDNTEQIDKKLLVNFEALLKDSSYVNVEKALVKLCAQFPERCRRYLDETSEEHGFAKNIRISWLKLASENNPKLLHEMVDYAGQSFEFRTRVRAIQTLSSLDFLNDNLMANLLDGYFSFNRYLSAVSKNALVQYAKDDRNRQKILTMLSDKKTSDKEKEKASRLISDLEPRDNLKE
jgi:aminopeptidase N